MRQQPTEYSVALRRLECWSEESIPPPRSQSRSSEPCSSWPLGQISDCLCCRERRWIGQKITHAVCCQCLGIPVGASRWAGRPPTGNAAKGHSSDPVDRLVDDRGRTGSAAPPSGPESPTKCLYLCRSAPGRASAPELLQSPPRKSSSSGENAYRYFSPMCGPDTLHQGIAVLKPRPSWTNATPGPLSLMSDGDRSKTDRSNEQGSNKHSKSRQKQKSPGPCHARE